MSSGIATMPLFWPFVRVLTFDECWPATFRSCAALNFVTVFAMLFIITTSPFSNVPLISVIPEGRSDFLFFSASIAPLSTQIVPAGLLLSIHRRRLDSFLLGMNSVPMSEPLMIRGIMFLALPFAITTRQPASEAILAASIFVFIPPVAWMEPLLPAVFSIWGVIS